MDNIDIMIQVKKNEDDAFSQWIHGLIDYDEYEDIIDEVRSMTDV